MTNTKSFKRYTQQQLDELHGWFRQLIEFNIYFQDELISEGGTYFQSFHTFLNHYSPEEDSWKLQSLGRGNWQLTTHCGVVIEGLRTNKEREVMLSLLVQIHAGKFPGYALEPGRTHAHYHEVNKLKSDIEWKLATRTVLEDGLYEDEYRDAQTGEMKVHVLTCDILDEVKDLNRKKRTQRQDYGPGMRPLDNTPSVRQQTMKKRKSRKLPVNQSYKDPEFTPLVKFLMSVTGIIVFLALLIKCSK